MTVSDGNVENWASVGCEGFLLEDESSWRIVNCEGFEMTGSLGAFYELRVPCSGDLSFVTVYGARCKVKLVRILISSNQRST